MARLCRAAAEGEYPIAALPDSDAARDLAEIQQPALVFQGRKDLTVAPEAGEIILNGISSTVKEHHWMENSSHAIVLDAEREEVAKHKYSVYRKSELASREF